MTPILIFLAVILCQSTCQELPPVVPTDANRKTAILKETFLRYAKQCSSMHATTTAQILALLIDDKNNDQEGKCFLLCMLQRYRLVNDVGLYNRDKIKTFLSYIPESAFLRSIKRNLTICSKEKGLTTCETAAKFIRCFYTKARLENKSGAYTQE